MENSNGTTESSPVKTETQASKEVFRTKLTEKYNWFLNSYGGLLNGRVWIYEVPEFTGDWSKVSPEDYFAFRLSVKGLKPEPGQQTVSVTQVNAELDQDRAVALRRSESLASAQKAYYQGENTARLELNDYIYVSERRLKELVSNCEFPAAAAFSFGKQVGVLLNAESTKDSKEFLFEVAHETGHLERKKSGKDDTIHDAKKKRLEEGIVQAKARTVAERGGFADAKEIVIYDFETSIAIRLANKLGVDLMRLSHAETEQMMRQSPTFSSLSENPYQSLIDNMDIFLRAAEEVDKAGDKIDPKHLAELAKQFNQADKEINRLLG